MQCVVNEVYSSLVVEVVWWDSPLMNIGDIVDMFNASVTVILIHSHIVVTMRIIDQFLMDVISGCILFDT